MVYRPSRGDAPPRFGEGVRKQPLVGGTVSADEYRDPMRYEMERETALRTSWMLAGHSSEMPNENDWITYEGHGETIVITRQKGGGVAAFHNVCQHRGARLTRNESSGCQRRFSCPWHGWVYDTTGNLVGVPERDDFDPALLEGLRSPKVAVEEWGGFVWMNLAGPDDAPPLQEWIGSDIINDLGKFRMEDMKLQEKWTVEVPTNYKVIVDGFNEVYHATELHHTSGEFTKAARDTQFVLTGPNSMMFVPRHQHRDALDETGDHQQYTICHYVIFPNTVFNNNPEHIQVFQPIPIGVDRTKFICWELVYNSEGENDQDFAAYWERTMAHWEELKGVVAEDLFVFAELDATRHSMAYNLNRFSTKECKPVAYHETMNLVVRGHSAMERWNDFPAGGAQ
jgi:phenylpropionate dioxygenase-like ring-hydroxylating dioxygenase large terminal subunit